MRRGPCPPGARDLEPCLNSTHGVTAAGGKEQAPSVASHIAGQDRAIPARVRSGRRAENDSIN